MGWTKYYEDNNELNYERKAAICRSYRGNTSYSEERIKYDLKY
jgi:hypothetical protein